MISSRNNVFLYHPNKESFPEATGMAVLQVQRLEILLYLCVFADILSDPYKMSFLFSFAISLTFHLFSLS